MINKIKQIINKTFFRRVLSCPIFERIFEFEPIYREEAKGRQKEHGGTAPGKHSCTNGAEVLGTSREFMARDSAASKNSVERVLYIKAHDPERLRALAVVFPRNLIVLPRTSFRQRLSFLLRPGAHPVGPAPRPLRPPWSAFLLSDRTY